MVREMEHARVRKIATRPVNGASAVVVGGVMQTVVILAVVVATLLALVTITYERRKH